MYGHAATGGNGNELRRLADTLDAIEERRQAEGGFASADDAAAQLRTEHRMLQLLGTYGPSKEHRAHVRLPCDLWVKVRLFDLEEKALVMDIGLGGVFIASDLPVRTEEEVELVLPPQPGTLEQELRIVGEVAWVAKPGQGERQGFGVVFMPTHSDDATERRRRRFIIRLIRRRLAASEG